MTVGAADGAEHAQGSEAPPGHHRESGHRQQADEEQPQRAEDEHERFHLDLGARTAAAHREAGAAGDAEDLEAFQKRKREPNLDFEQFVKALKRRGKL